MTPLKDRLGETRAGWLGGLYAPRTYASRPLRIAPVVDSSTGQATKPPSLSVKDIMFSPAGQVLLAEVHTTRVRRPASVTTAGWLSP